MSKILIVDDDRAFRKLLTAALRNEGYQLYQAENGRDALEKARTTLPDLMVLDCNPAGNSHVGCEVARMVWQDSLTKHCKIILVSGNYPFPGSIELVRTRYPKASDFLVKPFSPLFLRRRIRELLAPPCVAETLNQPNPLDED